MILTVLSMLTQALGVVGQFKGNAQVAKTTGYVQDAVQVVGALAPLVQQFGAGHEVTPDDVRAALAGKDAALKSFDELIAAKSAGT